MTLIVWVMGPDPHTPRDGICEGGMVRGAVVPGLGWGGSTVQHVEVGCMLGAWTRVVLGALTRVCCGARLRWGLGTDAGRVGEWESDLLSSPPAVYLSACA